MTGYVTGFNLNYPDYSLEYTNVGSIPNPNITWPVKTDFVITASSINDYSINAKKPYLWRAGTWQFFDTENFTTWVVYSPTDEHAFAEMPAEIIAQHPGLALSKMTYKVSKIFTQAISYDDYVDASFAAEPTSQGVTDWHRIVGFRVREGASHPNSHFAIPLFYASITNGNTTNVVT